MRYGKRRIAISAIVVLLVTIFAAGAAAGETGTAAPPRNVVLVGWDGAQRNHVREALERGELPALRQLSTEGALVAIDIHRTTDTKAGWTQILTGYYPQKTGVFSNSRYQPIPEGYSVFERLETFFGPDKIDTVAVIGKKAHVDAEPPTKVPFDMWQKKRTRELKADKVMPNQADIENGKIVEENGQKFVLLGGKPWANATNHMDLFVNGLEQTARVGQRAIKELEARKDRRFFFFVHFAEPDHAGHKNGENSQAYTDVVRVDDEWTGKIVAKLKELGLYDKTLVYVTADHGFDEGGRGHRYAPYVFLATNDKNVTRNGNRADIAPTVLKRFGLDLAKIDPPLDGIPLDEPAPDRIAPPSKPAWSQAAKAGGKAGPGGLRKKKAQPAAAGV